MIIPEDGCLPKITRTGFAAFNNVMIIKVPEKYRKPGETLYQLATLDRSKKGERWPADRYIDGSNPEVEPETPDHDGIGNDFNTNEKTKIINGEKIISSIPRGSEVHANKYERNKTLLDNALAFYGRKPTHVGTERPGTSQISDNAFPSYSLPTFKHPINNSDFSKNVYDGLISERPPPKSFFNKKGIFNTTGTEHEYNQRFPNETNFEREKMRRNIPNNYAPDSTFAGYPRDNFPESFSHERKYNNLHQNGPPVNESFGDRFDESSKSAFGSGYFKNGPPMVNGPPIQDGPENSYIEPHPVNPRNFPMGHPRFNRHRPPPPQPNFHLVRPFKPSRFAKPPESTHVRPFGDIPADIGRNVPSDIRFTDIANGTYGPEPFPQHVYDGLQQRNMPSCSDNYRRMNNYDPLGLNAPHTDFDNIHDSCPTTDYSRRNVHPYNNGRDMWRGRKEPTPFFNENFRDTDNIQGNNYKARNQQPWRAKNKFYRGRRRDNRNNKNNRDNDKKNLV